MTLSRLAVLCALLLLPTVRVSAQAETVPFSWDQATIYHLITDRFSNGTRDNDSAYGRGLDGNGSPYDVDSTGHFLGGDFQGLKGWVEDGYFSDLGVNALLISAPFEQVHGWIGGGFGEFQRYGYDGSWPLDYTETDLAYGTKLEFEALMGAAHAAGLKVLIDVNINGVGLATLNDMAAFDFGGITSDEWRGWRPASKSGWQSYNDRLVTITDSTESWSKWWGPEWIRADVPGYEPCGEPVQTHCADQLPDLREDVVATKLPSFLKLKWGDEKTTVESADLDAFFKRTGYQRSATNHIIKWLTDWVRSYGIDGFVLNHPESVSPESIQRLKEQATRALADWKAAQGMEGAPDAPFWFAGNVSDHGLEKSEFFKSGFDSIFNYGFTGDLQKPIDLQFATYAESINKDASFHVSSFLSSSATGLYGRSGLQNGDSDLPNGGPDLTGGGSGLPNGQDLKDAATRLLLSPGAVVIYYGDESGRPLGRLGVDELERTKSNMNWAHFDEDLVRHWQKIGSFRAAHPAVARGGHDKLSDAPYTFYRGVRQGLDTDEVIVVMGANGKTRVNVSIVWPDDTVLRDAYTGNVAIVSFGQATFTADASGLILIEEVR